MAGMGACEITSQTARVERKVRLNQSNSRWNIIFAIDFKLWVKKKKSSQKKYAVPKSSII